MKASKDIHYSGPALSYRVEGFVWLRGQTVAVDDPKVLKAVQGLPGFSVMEPPRPKPKPEPEAAPKSEPEALSAEAPSTETTPAPIPPVEPTVQPKKRGSAIARITRRGKGGRK